METQYIREFLVLSELCNYRAAAEQLFVSRASLFKHIKSLEQEIGVSLFEREGKRIVISQYGQLFLPYATQILRMEDRFIKDVDTAFHRDPEVLLIGTQYRVTDVVSSFLRGHEQYRLRTIEGGQLDELLYREQCELVFARNPDLKNPNFCFLPYTKDCLAAILPVEHPLAGRSSIGLADLRHESFVALSGGAGSDRALSCCSEAGFEPKVVMTAAPGTEVARLVSQGIGVALLNKNVIRSTVSFPIAVVEIYPQIPFEIYLCWRKEVPLSPVAASFVEFIREQTEKEPIQPTLL